MSLVALPSCRAALKWQTDVDVYFYYNCSEKSIKINLRVNC